MASAYDRLNQDNLGFQTQQASNQLAKQGLASSKQMDLMSLLSNMMTKMPYQAYGMGG